MSQKTKQPTTAGSSAPQQQQQKDVEELIKEGSKFAQAAVAFDHAGGPENEQKAMQSYMIAVEMCTEAIRRDRNPTRKAAVAAKTDQYLTRAEELKELIRLHQQAARAQQLQLQQQQLQQQQQMLKAASSTPTPTSTSTMASSPASSTAAAANPAQTQKPFVDPEITAAISDSLVTGAIKLKESGIHIKIGEALRYTFNKAVEIDKEYELHQKAIALAKQGLHKAKEIDQEYEIHQKVGEVIGTGFQVAASATKAYIATPVPPANGGTAQQAPQQPQQQQQR